MRFKLLWIPLVIILGLYVFAKANPMNPTVMQVNEFFGRNQQLLLTGMTDTGETNTLPEDAPWQEISLEENDVPVICTMEYAPVCAEVKVQCVKAPCPPIKETFGNRCQMNANKLAKFLYNGECSDHSIDKADCPSWSQPAPSFCSDGTIVDGGTDDNWCDLPPKCKK